MRACRQTGCGLSKTGSTASGWPCMAPLRFQAWLCPLQLSPGVRASSGRSRQQQVRQRRPRWPPQGCAALAALPRCAGRTSQRLQTRACNSGRGSWPSFADACRAPRLQSEPPECIIPPSHASADVSGTQASLALEPAIWCMASLCRHPRLFGIYCDAVASASINPAQVGSTALGRVLHRLRQYAGEAASVVAALDSPDDAAIIAAPPEGHITVQVRQVCSLPSPLFPIPRTCNARTHGLMHA